jgi:hypothetical protein
MERLTEADTERFLLELVADRRSGALDNDRFLAEDSTAMGTGDTLLVVGSKTNKDYSATEGQLQTMRDAHLVNLRSRDRGWEVMLLPAAFAYADWVNASAVQRAVKTGSQRIRKYVGWALLVLLGAILGAAGTSIWQWLSQLITNTNRP